MSAGIRATLTERRYINAKLLLVFSQCDFDHAFCAGVVRRWRVVGNVAWIFSALAICPELLFSRDASVASGFYHCANRARQKLSADDLGKPVAREGRRRSAVSSRLHH